MTNYVFNSATKLQLENRASNLPDALLISGAPGIGLTAAAHYILRSSNAIVVTVLPEKDGKVDIETGNISIDSIRRLYDLTKTIEPHGRVIIIDYAERMAAPAQNAFLKFLEEPSHGTHFILLSHQPEQLLPTILSRVQRLDMQAITHKQSSDLLDSLKVTDERKKTQILFIASGLPAELTKLSINSDYFEQRSNSIRDAREFVTGTPYNRLLLAKKYKDNRSDALIMIADAMKLIRNTIVSGGSELSIATITQLERIYSCIESNGNIRLQLASL